MNNEILDSIEENDLDNKTPINRIILISIATILLFLLLEELREILPEDFIIKPTGFLIIVVLVLSSILISNNLNKVRPKLKIIQVVFYTGFTIFLYEIIFKIVQVYFLADNWDYSLLKIIRAGINLGIMGMLIGNIRIHKLRGKKTLIPTLLLIVTWTIIAQIYKNYVNFD